MASVGAAGATLALPILVSVALVGTLEERKPDVGPLSLSSSPPPPCNIGTNEGGLDNNKSVVVTGEDRVLGATAALVPARLVANTTARDIHNAIAIPTIMP